MATRGYSNFIKNQLDQVIAPDIQNLQVDVSALQSDASGAALERVALQDNDVEHDQKLESRLLDLQTMLDVFVVEVDPPIGPQKLSDGSGNYLEYNSSSTKYEFTATDPSVAVSVEFETAGTDIWSLKDGNDYIASDGTQKSVLDGDDSDTYRLTYAPAKVGEDRLAIRHLTFADEYMGRGNDGVFKLGPDSDKFVLYEEPAV